MSDEAERQALIQQLQRISEELGAASVPRHEFMRRTGISERKVMLLFGSYNELIKAAGLQPHIFPTSDLPKYTDQDLLDEIVRVLRLPNSKFTRIFFDQNSIGGKSSVIERRFGGWINAIRSAIPLLDSVADRQLIERAEGYVLPQISAPYSTKDDSPLSGTESESSNVLSAENEPGHDRLPGNGNLYGDFINFRGLQHAPVNEQGVVFLFGMICKELGYVVEIIKPGFPDCEAKRRVRGKPGLWQRVRIEFEFQSRSFRAHGHDPDQCDMIVCWEDNWPDCPIEVLALENVLKNMPTEGG